MSDLFPKAKQRELTACPVLALENKRLEAEVERLQKDRERILEALKWIDTRGPSEKSIDSLLHQYKESGDTASLYWMQVIRDMAGQAREVLAGCEE